MKLFIVPHQFQNIIDDIYIMLNDMGDIYIYIYIYVMMNGMCVFNAISMKWPWIKTYNTVNTVKHNYRFNSNSVDAYSCLHEWGSDGLRLAAIPIKKSHLSAKFTEMSHISYKVFYLFCGRKKLESNDG